MANQLPVNFSPDLRSVFLVVGLTVGLLVVCGDLVGAIKYNEFKTSKEWYLTDWVNYFCA